MGLMDGCGAAEGREADVSSLGKVASQPADQSLPESARARAVAMARYSAALQAEVAGDMRAAFGHYREVLRANGADAELVRRTMQLAMSYGEEGEAEKLLVELRAERPTDPEPILRTVEFLEAYQTGPDPVGRADALLRDALARFPENVEVVTMAVRRHLAQGRRSEAEALMKQVKMGEGGDAGYWLTLAGVAQEVWPLGQAEVAEAHRAEVNGFYDKAMERAIAAKDGEREMEVAQYYVLSNQLVEARQICERMAARDGHLAARKLLYRLYESQELEEKAFALLEGIVRDDPKDVSQRRLLADVLEKREQYAEAARHLEAAIQVGTGTAADYEKLTNLWLGLRQPDKALTLVARAIRLFPDTPGFHAQQAMAYSVKEDLPRAIDAFAEADRLATSGGAQAFNHRFYFRFGVVLEKADRHEEAARQFERSIEATPESESAELANTLNYLGYMWVELGRHLDKAAGYIGKAVALEPENPAFIDSLGWLYHKQGKHEGALRELRRAESLMKELQPEDAEVLEHIGVVQEALGEKAAAVETLKRAAALQTPDEVVARRILGTLKRLEKALAADEAAPAKK
jgi:tetratricopeptide (TPR) repeat protein